MAHNPILKPTIIEEKSQKLFRVHHIRYFGVAGRAMRRGRVQPLQCARRDFAASLVAGQFL